jgi:hypothetical protein
MISFDEDEIRAEAHKRQKEMGDAARAAEMTKKELALEKRKGLAEKEAAPEAATGQAGTVKRAAGEAARKAATGQQARSNAQQKKPRAKLQRGKQARTSAQRETPNERLQRGEQARTSTHR